uniref:Interferon stimulated gene 15-2 n=1 Tax=Gadus morhua TaxID=8049 RepID=D1GFC9_GADMO|nr:interferon stimulated gene 15-2 [Gadus morhua]
MNITITLLGGEPRPLIVPPGTTVGSLKILIFQKFHISPERLSVDKIILDDDLKDLGFYGVLPCANIFVLVQEPNNIQVFLKTEKGENHTYNIRPGETVAGFKVKVKQREGVAEDQQRLIHEGKQLDHGSHTLVSYNVREGSTIFLTGRLRGG